MHKVEVLEGFESWWRSQDWGSVPDWVAGLGAVGAILFGVATARRELTTRRTAWADQFVVNVHFLEQSTDNRTRFRGTAYNLGEAPVTDPFIDYFDLRSQRLVFPIGEMREDAKVRQVLGGTSSDFGVSRVKGGMTGIFGGPRAIDRKTFRPLVVFTDGHGVKYVRNIATDRYISLRKYDRRCRRNPLPPTSGNGG